MSQAVGVTAASLAPSSVPMGPTALSVIHGAVRLRGCSNEPIFTNLVSLLYEHVVQPLALPCVLRFPFKSPTPLSNLPSLIALSRSAHTERLTHHGRLHHPPFGVHHSADDSPTAGRGRSDVRRGTLTRHPSDPLPSDTCMSGTFYSMHTAGPLPPGQYPPSRHSDALELARGPIPPRGRSPTSAYETEYGPVQVPSAMPGSAKWRSKSHSFIFIDA
ncbi:Tensin-1 [Fasciola gigantica]|uniref:Tensin-1 n=1 Tax=Fasciola gigantica TaxID=46835 RepID=A0A504YL41_FASGI|nr:Tensin-1 [Fasciola gigantica]